MKSMVHVEALEALPEIRHAFFTRNKGVSGGLYESNNCAFGSDDPSENVEKNRASCTVNLGMRELVTVQQKHTSTVVEVKEPWTHKTAPVADALVTRERGIALGILTADCAPVLLADNASGVVAAAHAGWKGASEKILENTVKKMVDLGANPQRTVAAVGPCIAQKSYEVGPEFAARFEKMDETFVRYFANTKTDGHAYFDLATFVVDKLRECGIGTISMQGDDTCANERQYFSYRRSVLREVPDYGRQLSAIGLIAK